MNENKKSVKKVIKLNIDYVKFISDLIKEKIVNINKIEEKYENDLSLNFNNIKRVDSRNKRKELNNVLSIVCKENNISIEDYLKKSKEIVKSKNKELKYYEVEV